MSSFITINIEAGPVLRSALDVLDLVIDFMEQMPAGAVKREMGERVKGLKMSVVEELTRVISVTVNTQNVAARLAELQEKVTNPATDAIKDGFHNAAKIYLGFVRNRFVQAARGDGTWTPLAESTKQARLRKTKKGAAKFKKAYKADKKKNGKLPGPKFKGNRQKLLAAGNFEILRDTGLLLNSLSDGSPGNVMTPTLEGVTVGTAIKYAQYHQNPTVLGRPPQRLILVEPDDDTMHKIQGEIQKAVAKVIEQVMKKT